jgi:hypothetical protein
VFPDPAVEAELVRLEKLDLRQLRALWSQQFGSPSKIQSAELIRWRLAYEIQVRAYGGLCPNLRRRLFGLHQAFSDNPSYVPHIRQRRKVGTILTREWNGVRHEVTILKEGFEYGDRIYGSLSEIAQRITGTKWSGPTFFGMRMRS